MSAELAPSGEVCPQPAPSILETVDTRWPVQGTRFNTAAGTLLVDVDEADLIKRIVEPPTLSEFEEHGFQPNPGLHMTVVGYDNGEKILRALRHLAVAKQEAMLQTIVSMAGNLDWSWQPIGDLQPFQGRKNKALKIVTRVECPDFITFYDGMKELIPSADFRLYPPHITLLKQEGKEMRHRTPARIGGLAMHIPLLSLSHPAPEQ